MVAVKKSEKNMINIASTILNVALIAGIGGAAFADNAANEEQLKCLADNIYHEARGETVLGQIAVAQVTINRVDHNYFPDTVCGVVWQPSQFSWTHDGKTDTASDQEAYAVARSVAETVYNRDEDDPTNKSLFYHATSIEGGWFRDSLDYEITIGNHRFYNWSGTWN